MKTLLFAGAALLASAQLLATPVNITGAGASFPQPIYVQWAQSYHQANGARVNYQSIGSSGGVKQITAKTVDFGATDSPLSAEALEEQGLMQFPTVIGGVVPVVNIEGIKPGELKLNGEILADIYLGNITRWNDAKITALNEGTTLPDAPITTIFRADGSGTSFIFTTYLSEISPAWKEKVGAANTVTARSFGIYHDDPHAIPTAQLYAQAAMESDSAETQAPLVHCTIRGGRYAILRHQGSYAELEHAYDWFYRDWLLKSGEQIADAPPFEEYLNDVQTTPPEQLLTDIYIPLAN